MTVVDEFGEHVGWADVDLSVFRGGYTFEWPSTLRGTPYPTQAFVSTEIPPLALDVRRFGIRIDYGGTVRRGVIALVLERGTAPEDLEKLFPFTPSVRWLMDRVRREIANAMRTG